MFVRMCMNNRTIKPKQTAVDLVSMLRDEKGIQFKLIDEQAALDYLSNRNNYLRTASYRKNYDKHTTGINAGKYIDLEFAYLIELSRIDMYLRDILLKMCIDIEHALKVKLISDIENNSFEDGYTVVDGFLAQNSDVLNSIAGKSESIFTGNLIEKYFNLCYVFDQRRKVNTQVLSVDCPAWVLVEILAFNDFLHFLDFYCKIYPGRITFDRKNLNVVRSLRNACAHNNCLLFSMRPGDTRPNHTVTQFVSKIPNIGHEERKNKLSCRPLFEIVVLLMEYTKLVSQNIQSEGIAVLKNFLNGRLMEHYDYFSRNQVISTSFNFLQKIVDNLA